MGSSIVACLQNTVDSLLHSAKSHVAKGQHMMWMQAEPGSVIMSAQQSSQARLQTILDTWSSTKAIGFLSKPAPAPLPTRGPLHKLLVTTKRLLPAMIDEETASEAVRSGAALLLAKLASWLQQQPEQLLMQPSSFKTQVWDVLHREVVRTIVQLSGGPSTVDEACQLLNQLGSSGN